ncbi:MAG: alpha/beta hydrolase [Tsuneonella sp.]
MGIALVLGLLALAGFGLWRWAVTQGSAATLEWIDARFSRETPVVLAAQGAYGTDPAQRAELWVPAGEKSDEAKPMVVFVHGGGWHSGAPEDYRFVARTLAQDGFATALVGYRLVPGGRYPAMLEDTAAGIAWARKVAAGKGVRPDGIVLSGHSAGAYNVLMLTLDTEWLAAAGVPESAIGGTVSMAGPADFYPFTSDSARNALGHVADPATTQPITFARGDAAPILLLHGITDDVVRVRNSRNLADAIRAKGGRVEEREFDGMGHAGIIMGLSKPFAQDGIVTSPLVAFARQASEVPRSPGPQPSVPVQRETR